MRTKVQRIAQEGHMLNRIKIAFTRAEAEILEDALGAMALVVLLVAALHL